MRPLCLGCYSGLLEHLVWQDVDYCSGLVKTGSSVALGAHELKK